MFGAVSGTAGEEAADHPLPQSQEPGVKPQAAAATAAAGCMDAQQQRAEQHGESQCSQQEKKHTCFGLLRQINKIY